MTAPPPLSFRPRRTPVYGLDAVRFLAAALVVAYHLGFKAWALPESTLGQALGVRVDFPPGYWLTCCGWVGVQIFFVVSGAVIAYSAGGVTARRFARRRAARLLPCVLIAVAIALPVAIAALAMPPQKAAWLGLKTLAFAPWGPWLIGQFWTIPIELGFYALVWALLALRREERGTAGLAWCLGLVGAAYWIAVTAGWLAPGGRLSELLLLQHGLYFALGIVCARLGGGTLAPRHLMLALACIVGAALQVRMAARWEMAARPDLAGHWPLAYAIWLAATALVALSFLYRDAVAGAVEGAGKGAVGTGTGRLAGALRLAGLSTYPLYLVHFHIGGAILLAASGFGPMPALAAASAGSLLAALAIAIWCEPPLHGALDAGIARFGSRAWRRLRLAAG